MNINIDATCECGAGIEQKLVKILFCEKMTVNHTLKAECHLILKCDHCERVNVIKIRNIDTNTIPETYTGIPIK